MQPGECLLRSDDQPDGTPVWLRFRHPQLLLTAVSTDEVAGVVRQAAEAAEVGNWAVGFLAYEAAPAFDPAFRVASRSLNRLPLAAFVIYHRPDRLIAPPPPDVGAGFGLGDWLPVVNDYEYMTCVADIYERIAAGETYQVNFTYALRGSFTGDPYTCWHRLYCAQPTPYAAFIRLQRHAILSVSPELFFRQEGDRLRVRPMKGTAPRGRWSAEDDARATALAASAKERAENVMIVDLLRNDLGRVAAPGSVRVTSLFDIERHPTVLQMTSTVDAITHGNPADTLAALFPCGSVTGAPKVRTMQVIHELEGGRPRGVYTGAIGWFAPGQRARFSVAIRTLQLDGLGGSASARATWGIGSGITWDADAAAELAETRAKALVVTDPPDPAPFALLESMVWLPEPAPDGEIMLLERHLQRLVDGSRYFGYHVSAEVIRSVLRDCVVALPPQPHKLRLTVTADGAIGLTHEPVGFPVLEPDAAAGEPLRVGLAAEPVNPADPFLYHKTTRRAVYDRALAARPDVDDVLLFNPDGELTESTRCNVVVGIDGGLWTPPRECGLLAGTFRDELVERGRVVERRLRVDNLARAEALWLVNSVRGWLLARFVDPPPAGRSTPC